MVAALFFKAFPLGIPFMPFFITASMTYRFGFSRIIWHDARSPAGGESAFKQIETPILTAGFLGYCCARTGRREEAIALLHQLEMLPDNVPPPAYQMAIVHLGLGDDNAALHWLDRACDTCSWGIHLVKFNPIWDPLRHDPRFESLLKKMNLS
jgi:hypothetical protein